MQDIRESDHRPHLNLMVLFLALIKMREIRILLKLSVLMALSGQDNAKVSQISILIQLIHIQVLRKCWTEFAIGMSNKQ